MKLAITNHTGARNRGCEALVLSKILGFKRQIDGVEIELLSHDPLYDAWRFKGRAGVKYSYLTRTPEHPPTLWLNSLLYKGLALAEKVPALSVRADISMQKTLHQADLVVPSGGDIFTSDYHNLRKHLSILVATPTRSKIYLCGHTIGPFTAGDEAYFKKVITRADLITVRETESLEYLQSLQLDLPVHLTADVAFTLPTLEKAAARQYLESHFGIKADDASLVGLSVSQGIIKYSQLEADDYYDEFARFVDYLNEQGRTCLLIPHVMETNPDNNDVISCEQVMARVRHPQRNRILFGEPSAVNFKGMIGLCDCLVGTRTHSTIASLSQYVPTVSIAYSRKAYGIMQDVFGQSLGKQLTVDVSTMRYADLVDAFELAMENAPGIENINAIKQRAEQNFSLVSSVLG